MNCATWHNSPDRDFAEGSDMLAGDARQTQMTLAARQSGLMRLL